MTPSEMSYQAHIRYYLHIIDKNKRLGRNKAHITHKIYDKYVVALEDMGYTVTNGVEICQDYLSNSTTQRTRQIATIEWDN